MEAIVLAGGLGTRLRTVISDRPKPMAPVGNKPFLCYILDYLLKQGIKKVIFSTGYMHEVIETYFGNCYKGLSITYSIEEKPLGTGGGIKRALTKVTNENVFILNGDTFFNVDLNGLFEKHMTLKSDITLSLKKMENIYRYGIVKTTGNRVIKFEEKKFVESGYINGGIYVASVDLFNRMNLPVKFSFETDLMENYLHVLNIAAYISNGFFIDIGVPEDYQLAQVEMSKWI